MGEAIAQLREAALAIRRQCDEDFSSLNWEVEEPASRRHASNCRRLMRDFEAGAVTAKRFAFKLNSSRRVAELRPVLDANGQRKINFLPAGWLSPCMANISPNINDAFERAAKEASRWGSMLGSLDSRMRALRRATLALMEAESNSGEPEGAMANWRTESYGELLSRWQEAYGSLAAFEGEPGAPVASPEKKTGGKQAKPRSRAGVGGRPAKFPIKFIREVVAARERDRKHARTLRRPLPPIPRWLSDYCTAKQIDIGKTFPQSVPGEAWSDRANRFWKAATKRLREAETNRH